MIPGEDDIALWKAGLDGNKAAFGQLYRYYFPLLYTYGVKLTGDKELVRDVIQDLFVNLFQEKVQVPVIGHWKGYLFQAFRNRLVDKARQAKPTYDIADYENVFVTEMPFGEGFGTDEVREEQGRLLLRAYKQLPPRQQEILYLFYIKELKHEEIAGILHINCQSSKNLLFRAIGKLRALCFPPE
ncbi:MAG: sigma-70 family RNA polymerase sigma factor [Parabacteroides sp.]|nr:sigma-70 family RNA polymerase sigma factor [Parabacteroides sp.]